MAEKQTVINPSTRVQFNWSDYVIDSQLLYTN